MSKLTHDLKSTIKANACTSAGLDKQHEQIQAAKATLAEDLYSLRMSEYKHDIPHIEALEKSIAETIPEGLRCSIVLVGRGTRQLYNVGGEVHRIDYPGEPRILDTKNKGFAIQASHPLAKRLTKLNNQAADLKDRYDQVKAEVGAVLSSVNTIPQLLKVWPEAKELLPERNKPAPAQLPAVQIQHLNSVLGLPTDSETE